MDKKYNEYKVTLDRKGNVADKKLTERGHVMISKNDAEDMNTDFKKTKLFYELAEEPKVVKKRAAKK